jgi:hypothetical protein
LRIGKSPVARRSEAKSGIFSYARVVFPDCAIAGATYRAVASLASR